MAKIDIGPLQDHLQCEELANILVALEDQEMGDAGVDDDCLSTSVAAEIDDDAMMEFTDKLEANDASCDIYLPVAMEDIVRVDGRKIGSIQVLLSALEELSSEIGVAEERMDDFDELAQEEDQEEDDGYLGETDDWHNARASVIWKALMEAAALAVENNAALFLHV